MRVEMKVGQKLLGQTVMSIDYFLDRNCLFEKSSMKSRRLNEGILKKSLQKL